MKCENTRTILIKNNNSSIQSVLIPFKQWIELAVCDPLYYAKNIVNCSSSGMTVNEITNELVSNITRQMVRPNNIIKEFKLDERAIAECRPVQFVYDDDLNAEYVYLSFKHWVMLSKLDVCIGEPEQQGVSATIQLKHRELTVPHAVLANILTTGNNLIKAWRLYRGYSVSEVVKLTGLKQTLINSNESRQITSFSKISPYSECYSCEVEQLTLFSIDESSKLQKKVFIDCSGCIIDLI